jgi:hypothetical protein
MPLLKGSSKKVISKNISEFHKGKTFAKTAKKFGKKKANAQAIAAAMNAAGKSRPVRARKFRKFSEARFESTKKRVFGL